ncbi:hypothetical protein [Olsenella urininfantis]|nr:hypothetical protein [Olsenella urininfantis]
MALLRKYSPEHMEAGVRYMEAALDKTSVMVLELGRVMGKGSAR